MGRKCIVAGCDNAMGLHGIPLDLKLRGQWLRAIGMEENSYLPTMSGVCDKHFTRDCFTNLTEFELGYTERLRLKSEAVPNTALPRRIQSPRILLPRPVEPKPFREIGCQTDSVLSKNALVQANVKPFYRSKAVQARAPGRSVYCDTSSLMDVPQPEIIRVATAPLKRQRCEVSGSNPSAHLNDSTSTVNFISTCTEVHSHKDKKHFVHEEQLLELFRRCPACTGHCSVDTTTIGTLLLVTQRCSQCEHNNQWSSQPMNRIPEGNLS